MINVQRNHTGRSCTYLTIGDSVASASKPNRNADFPIILVLAAVGYTASTVRNSVRWMVLDFVRGGEGDRETAIYSVCFGEGSRKARPDTNMQSR